MPDEQTATLAAALAAATALPYTVAACELHRPDGWSEGLAVLSSLPIVGSEDLEVEAWGKVCQWVRLQASAGRLLDVYNLHLNPHHADLRQRQLAAVLAWMGDHPGAAARVICGDFNTTADSDAIEQLVPAGFVSAHAERHGSEPERTFPTPLRPEVFARRPGEVIDFIFVDPRQLAVRDCRVTLDQPDPDNPALFPSDHAGLVADLAWR